MAFLPPSPIFHSFLILSPSPFSHINVQHGGVLCNFFTRINYNLGRGRGKAKGDCNNN